MKIVNGYKSLIIFTKKSTVLLASLLSTLSRYVVLESQLVRHSCADICSMEESSSNFTPVYSQLAYTRAKSIINQLYKTLTNFQTVYQCKANTYLYKMKTYTVILSKKVSTEVVIGKTKESNKKLYTFQD